MAPNIHVSHSKYPEISYPSTEIPILPDDPRGVSPCSVLTEALKIRNSPCPVLTEALKIRKTVFTDEQNVSPDIELDNYEDKSWHSVAFVALETKGEKSGIVVSSMSVPKPDAQMTPAGTVRLVTPQHYKPKSLDFLPWAAFGNIKKSDVVLSSSDDFASIRGKLPLCAKITRLAVSSDSRSYGVGRVLVRELERKVAEDGKAWKSEVASNGADEVILIVHGQAGARAFWEKQDYTFDPQLGGGLFYEGAIPHVGLWKRIPFV